MNPRQLELNLNTINKSIFQKVSNDSMNLKRKQFSGDKSESISLHALLSSGDSQNHQLAISMIENGADLAGYDSKGNTLLDIAIKNELFHVSKVLIERSLNNPFLRQTYENSMTLVMRRLNTVKLLMLFSQHCGLHFTRCCDYVPWDMSDGHLMPILKTMVHLAIEKDVCPVRNVLQIVILKRPKMAKLLISCRTNTNERLFNPQKLLVYNFVLNSPGIIAFLIKEGVNVNESINEKKQHALHVLLEYCGNIDTARLLLQLGVDVNIIDQLGNTPFSICFMSDCVLMALLLIKHFAYLTSLGKYVNEKDLKMVQSNPKYQESYEKCIQELDKMKTIDAADGFSFYWFFSKGSYKLSLLMKKTDTFNQAKKSIVQKSAEIFPTFKSDIIAKFGMIRHLKTILIARERDLEEVFGDILPSIVLCKIVRYSLDIADIEKEYHLKKFS